MRVLLIAMLCACSPDVGSSTFQLGQTCAEFTAALTGAGGALTVPAEGCDFGGYTIVSSPVQLSGGGPLRFAGDGRLAIHAPSTFDGVTLEWTRDLADPGTPRLIQLQASDIVWRDSVFRVDITEDPANPIDPYGGPHSWLMQLGQYGVTSTLSGLRLERNEWTSAHRYTTGAVATYAWTDLDAPLVAGNSWRGFHGVLYLLESIGAVVESNRLYRNSLGNINVSGEAATIRDNHILWAGNGTSGAGVYVTGGDNHLVENNLVQHASCYGMDLRGDNLVARNNIVSHGATSGMWIHGYPSSNALVEGNALVANDAAGILCSAFDGVTIRDNTLANDDAVDAAQCTSVTLEGNLATAGAGLATHGSNMWAYP